MGDQYGIVGEDPFEVKPFFRGCITSFCVLQKLVNNARRLFKLFQPSNCILLCDTSLGSYYDLFME